MTFVVGRSTWEEKELPLKSQDTSSSSTAQRIPFIGPSAYFLKALLTSSFVVVLETITTRSTSETLGVGTLMARPSSFPFISGITSPIALAAPVVVGIIDMAAARALRKSLC